MRNSVWSIVALALLLTATPERDSQAQSRRDVDRAGADAPIAAPWLINQLTDDALAYVRIPHPLGLLAVPKGNMLAQALASEGNVRNLRAIQAGLGQNLADDLPAPADPTLRFIFSTLRSPIEMAVMAAPSLSALVAMTTNLRSATDLEELFAELAQITPFPPLIAPLDANGYGQLLIDLPVYVHLDTASGRLTFYGGLAANLPGFTALVEAGAASVNQPMLALESQIDTSGQGFFAWIDAEKALLMGGPFLPPDVAQSLAATGLSQLRALAYGAGVADGKGRLKLIADFGTDSAQRLIPIVDNAIRATSVGDPRSMLLLSLPSAAEFARLEGLALASLPPEIAPQWTSVKLALAEKLGVSIDELLSAIGPDILTISDRAGDYVALRARDMRLLRDVLDRLAASAGVAIGEHRVGRQTIRDVRLPAGLGLPVGQTNGPPAALLSLIGRIGSRVYWVEDGDYLYAAGIPQLLEDRGQLGATSSIADWLRDSQRTDLSHAFLAATGTVDNLPRKIYQAYIGMMQGLADVAEVDYDVWALPTASELGLPERSTVGASINLGERYVSFELSYESNPAELLLGGGGTGAIAVAGILAAVAIPAYQDYTIRAQVAEGLTLAGGVRAASEQAYLANGVAPQTREAAGLSPASQDTSGQFVAGVDISNGAVVIRYGNSAHARIAGQTLVLVPYTTADGSVAWACGYQALPPGAARIGAATSDSTTMEPQYLPSGCRQQ
jgi:Tfp pilus assembly major pilin PilA